METLDLFQKSFTKEKNTDNCIEGRAANNIIYEINEEDRIVVALVASAMASHDKLNSEFHISKITRIK